VASQGSSNNSRLVAVGAVVLLLGVILVLLILRGSVGGDETAPDPVAAESADQDEEPDEASHEQVELVDEDDDATVRVPLPLEVEDGFEAVTVRVAYDRGLAALPQAGDRIVLYRLAADPEEQDADRVEEDADASAPPGDDAERVLDEVEVLGVIGPRPAANDGTLTFVVALEEDEVPGILPLARDGAIWFTLLPDEDGAGTDEVGDDADAEEAA
jgi:hypothetical protein